MLSLQGAATSINGRERSEGFHDCITKEHPNIELIERPTDWDATKQAAALQTVLAANPDLKGIFQQSDYALSPTLNVLKQAGRDAKVGEPDHIYNISIDASPQALELIRSGDLDAGISQPLDLYAKYGVQYLLDALAGKELAARQDRPRQRGRRVQRQQDGSASGGSGDEGERRRCGVLGEPGEVSSVRHGSAVDFQLLWNAPFDMGVEPLVEARAVSKRYGKTLALDNVSMKVLAGHSVALAGRNGAGKSTMVRLLTGLDRPDSGEVRFAGQPAPDVSARAQWRSRVACVYQKSTIIPELTVGENLFLNDQPGSRFGTIHWGEAPAARAQGARHLGPRRRRRPAGGRADGRPEAASRDRPRASAGHPLHHSRRADRAARAA